MRFLRLTNLLMVMTLLAVPGGVWAQISRAPGVGGEPGGTVGYTPPPLRDIGVDEKRDAQIPLTLAFTNESGKPVLLSELIKDRPVVLQLGYYECPMLCDLIADGWVESISQLDLKLGKDFDVISISISPQETFKTAAIKKQSFLRRVNKPISGDAVHYLVGSANNIKAITEATGYQYKYLPSNRQYSHPAVIIVLTPEGRIAQYLYGVKYEPEALKTAILDADAGKSGTPMEQILMTCYQLSKHVGGPMVLMRIGGALTVLVVIGIILRQVLRDRKQSERTEDPQPDTPPAASWN